MDQLCTGRTHALTRLHMLTDAHVCAVIVLCMQTMATPAMGSPSLLQTLTRPPPHTNDAAAAIHAFWL